MDHGKRNNASKVYVVFRGKRPGLYNSWHQCALMVIGVKGSIFKAFKTYDEAIAAFNEFRNGSQADRLSTSKVYVVFRGKKPGLYNSWCECAHMVIGFKGSIFKSYKSYDEAVAAFNEFQKENVYSEEQSSSSCVDESDVVASAMSSVLLAGMFVGMKISKNCSV
ncbi:PREDICTED: ribonuclease H-like [Nicotiana attenuata]|uniref:ribonuclease H-like n=1 Tax=Nicotiana attenuata TaxID=49451 RepID=UPI0009050111|nr:PREDICTED: ribonuclease H-like [Nicotiana attenuata]